MTVELTPELELRLRRVAEGQSLSVPQLVEQVLTSYLNSLADDSLAWVQTTQQQLSRAWGAEDFSAWRPPHAS